MYKTLQDFVGNTPLSSFTRLPGKKTPGGATSSRQTRRQQPGRIGQGSPALSMIVHAEARATSSPATPSSRPLPAIPALPWPWQPP